MLDKSPKTLAIVIVILLAVPVIVSCFVYGFHGRISVGIVLEESVDARFAEDARDGLLLYDDYIEPRIVEDRFNSSRVRMQNESYLSEDFNDLEFSKAVRSKNGVDALLIITNKSLANWLHHQNILWGEASIESASAVMTIFGYQNETAHNKVHIMTLAIHEVTHLVGYLHDSWDGNSIMRFVPMSLNFSFHQSFEFPFRVTLAPVVLEKDTWAALLIMNGLLALLFIPFAMAIIILLRILISKRIDYFNPTPAGLGSDISISFLIMMIAANIVLGIIFAVILTLLANFLLYYGAIVFKSLSKS